MHEIKVTTIGTYDIVQTIRLTDEQWENSVDPETGKLYDVDVVMEEVFNQSEVSGICAQCSGWGRNFSRSHSDETEIVYIRDLAGKTLYERD